MKVIFYSTIALLALASCGQNTSHFSNKATSKQNAIVGGLAVEENSTNANLAVLIRGQKSTPEGKTFNAFCTGSFITKNLILTAAHCFANKDLRYEVVYSVENKNNLNFNQTSPIEALILHENFSYGFQNQDGIRDDIAVVKIAGTKPEKYEILELPPELNISAPFEIQAIGYGRTVGIPDTQMTGQGAGILRTTTIKAIGINSSTSHFTVDQSLGKGVCQGDSGGPGIYRAFSKKYILGIVNSVITNKNDQMVGIQGDQQDICKQKARYLNVAFYSDWIKTKIALFN